MKTLLYALGLWLGTLTLAGAQQASVTAGDRFGWDMTGPGLAAIKSYRYEIEIDGQRHREALTGVQCDWGEPPVPFVCTAPLPPAIGAHAVRVRSIDVSVPGLPAIEGEWSPLFLYVMRPVQPTPGKLRVVKPKGLP